MASAARPPRRFAPPLPLAPAAAGLGTPGPPLPRLSGSNPTSSLRRGAAASFMAAAAGPPAPPCASSGFAAALARLRLLGFAGASAAALLAMLLLGLLLLGVPLLLGVLRLGSAADEDRPGGVLLKASLLVDGGPAESGCGGPGSARPLLHALVRSGALLLPLLLLASPAEPLRGLGFRSGAGSTPLLKGRACGEQRAANRARASAAIASRRCRLQVLSPPISLHGHVLR